jgi:UDP-glucose 4-epimerase
MRVLVTGGAGFIGSAVIQELQKFKHEIFVIDDLSFGNREFIDIPDSKFFNINILDKNAVENVFNSIDPEWVIHLAAIHFIPYCNKHPFESSDINIRGSINIINAVKKSSGIKKVFFASTAAVYPISDNAVNEEVSPLPLDIYGLSKLAGEHLFKELHLETQVPVVICRFFNAFGPNETNPHLIPEIQQQINNGQRVINLGNLTPKRDFIHTYDMSVAVRMLMEKFSNGYDVFNLGRGIEYSVTEIVEAFERVLGEKIKVEVDQARVRKVERMHLLADISKLKNFLKWEPTISIDEGISTLVIKNG